MSGEMKLTYFNRRGRAEMTRLLFKLAGKEFIDDRVDKETWQKVKPTTPKGQCPVLEVDGKMLCESLAIARYVARENNLYGESNWEAAIVDMTIDSVVLGFQTMAVYIFHSETEEAKAEALTKATAAMESMEKLMISLKKGQFILGEKASLADTLVYNLIEFCEKSDPEFKSDKFPTIAAIANSFSEIPAIADWIKTRPETAR